jgi:hypothetical protein
MTPAPAAARRNRDRVGQGRITLLRAEAFVAPARCAGGATAAERQRNGSAAPIRPSICSSIVDLSGHRFRRHSRRCVRTGVASLLEPSRARGLLGCDRRVVVHHMAGTLGANASLMTLATLIACAGCINAPTHEEAARSVCAGVGQGAWVSYSGFNHGAVTRCALPDGELSSAAMMVAVRRYYPVPERPTATALPDGRCRPEADLTWPCGDRNFNANSVETFALQSMSAPIDMLVELLCCSHRARCSVSSYTARAARVSRNCAIRLARSKNPSSAGSRSAARSMAGRLAWNSW